MPLGAAARSSVSCSPPELWPCQDFITLHIQVSPLVDLLFLICVSICSSGNSSALVFLWMLTGTILLHVHQTLRRLKLEQVQPPPASVRNKLLHGYP